jgi:hypothetical protein
MAQTYRTRLLGLAFMFAVLSVITLVVPAVILVVPEQPFLLLWLAAVAFGWYVMAHRTAYEIQLVDGDARFRSLTRRITVPIRTIRRVESHPRVLWVWSDGRRIDAFPIRDVDDLVRRIRDANPSVEVDGR